jgi:hypothetical protein
MKAVTAGFVALLILFFVAAGANQGAVTAAACTGPTPGQVPAPTSGHFTMKQLADLWVSVGGPSADVNGDGYGDAVEAAAIAMAESGGDPNAGRDHPYHGLWQVGPGGPFDPVENARAAVAKFTESQKTQNDGFLPWTTYTGFDTGPGGTRGPRTFLKFLTGATPGQTGSPDGAGCANPVGAPGTATAEEVLRDPHIILTPGQRADLASGGIDPRLLGLLTWIAHSHTIVITALRRDHSPGTNHEAGRAVDVGMVDGRLCNPYGPADSCGQLLIAVAHLPVERRPTEIIGGFDPDGPGPAWSQSDHRNHLHLAWDAV